MEKGSWMSRMLITKERGRDALIHDRLVVGLPFGPGLGIYYPAR